MMRASLFILLLASICRQTTGQENVKDSCSQTLNIMLKEQIVPAGLLAGSAILHAGNLNEKIQDLFPDSDTRLDDYLKFAPSVQMYTLDLLGFRHKNSVFTQTSYLAVSLASSAILVEVLKKVTGIKRPDGGEGSFPSRHTCIAFAGATALYHEFRENYPVLAYSGFVAAGATGLLRITNDAHWLPDVLAGAGLGILITNLIYYIDPVHGWPDIQKGKNISVVPEITEQGLCLRIIF